MRVAVVAVLSLAMLLAGQAVAAPKVACKLVTDPAGDARPVSSEHLRDAAQTYAPVGLPVPPVVQQGPSADALDIVSADVAAVGFDLTAVIRVKKLAVTAPGAAPTGITWFVKFTLDGVRFTAAAHTDPTGAKYFDLAYSTIQGGRLSNGGVRGVIDLARSEVRITVPLTLIGAQATVRPGRKLTEISAGAANEVAVFDKTNAAYQGAVVEYAVVNTDRATTSRTYAIGTRNCVVVGR